MSPDTGREALAAATNAVRQLFGEPCLSPPPMGVAMELERRCGRCAACTRDWTPEAAAILAVVQSRSPERATAGEGRAAHCTRHVFHDPGCPWCRTADRDLRAATRNYAAPAAALPAPAADD